MSISYAKQKMQKTSPYIKISLLGIIISSVIGLLLNAALLVWGAVAGAGGGLKSSNPTAISVSG